MAQDTVTESIWTKLDLIIAEVAKTNISLERLSGRQELLSQVLTFTAEAVKEEKVERLKQIAELKAALEAHDTRVKRLENWRLLILGGVIILSAIVNIFSAKILSALGL